MKGLILASAQVLFVLLWLHAAEAKSHVSADLLIGSDECLKIPTVLSDRQVTSDVDLLVYALEHAYAGRNYVQANLFAQALRKLTLISGIMSPEELKDKIDEILWTIPDNHMEAHLNYKCSPLRQSNRRNGDAGANAINSNSKVWQVRMDRRDDLSILYVSIRHFSPPGKAVWHGFLPEIKKKLSSSQLLVLDLRGNTGGDDRMGLKLAKICFGNKLNTAYARTIRSQTPETFALTANYFRRLQLSYELSGKKAPNNLNKKYEHFLQKMHRSENAHQVDEKVEAEVTKNYEFNATKGYDKPIYILMDGATASASESIIDTFEFQPNTKKVGRNTCGANHYGDCGELLLPNSKVEVAIPTAHRDYKDKRFIERIGIKPDLQVAKGQDAYSVAIEDYKKQALLPIR